MATPAELNLLLQSPAMAPPPGVTPNLVNPPVYWFKEWTLTAAVSITITTLFIMMRIYTKLFLIRNHAWEDYLSFLAWVLYVPYMLVDLIAWHSGAGVHLWNISIGTYSRWAQLVYAKELSNTPVIYITKLSILLQFERIFAPIHSGVAYWSIQAVIWLNALYYLACVLATVFLCNPMRKVWQPWIAGHCSNTNALIISSSLINLVSDLIIFVIPLFCVMKLQMPTSRKFGVAAVFAVGLFTCVVSILRTAASFKLARDPDVTYGILPLSMWADAEIAGGIICGCMPVLPQFVRHLAPKIKSVFSLYRLSSKNQFSSAKSSSIHKRGKAPDPYDDSCNLTGSYDMDSMPTLTTQGDKTDATLSTKELTLDDRAYSPRDLESATRR